MYFCFEEKNMKETAAAIYRFPSRKLYAAAFVETLFPRRDIIFASLKK
jgi:hypothetical protein